MKAFGKIMIMLLIGLSVAVIFYPFLHESGHSIAAVIVGGKVVEYHLFPIPNILCNVGNVPALGKLIIGISGILFPVIITTIIFRPRKPFWVWYANLILRGICALSVAITTVATVLYAVGKPVANEDITTVLSIVPNAVVIVAIASLMVMSAFVIIIARDTPLNKISDYLLK